MTPGAPTALRVLQTGTYASWNKGDAAMQLGTAAAVRRRWPDAEVTISAPFPERDRAFYDGTAGVVRCRRRQMVFASLQVARAGGWRLLRRLTGRDARWLIPDQELQACRRADVVVDLSGDMLTEDYGPHVAWSHYIPILTALLLDRPVVVCAQSVGPFRHTARLARWMFERVAAITVRDRISLGHLEQIGVDVAAVRLTADMAFLLEPSPPQRAEEILAAEGFRPGGRPVLGVSVSRLLERRHRRAASPGAPPFVEVVAAALDRFAAGCGVEVLLVPHVTGPRRDGDDREIGDRVAAAMSAPAHALRGDYRPEELKAVIGRCDLFVGARMHANIAALSSGVPVVALSYSHKTPGIMALFGQEGLVVDGAELSTEALERKLAAAWQDRREIRAALERAAVSLRAAAAENLEVVAAAAGGRGHDGGRSRNGGRR